MKTKLALLGLAVLIPATHPIPARAMDLSCPFLNAATAEGVLGGGPVTAKIEGVEDNGRCEFTRVNNQLSSSLRIEVKTMKNPRMEFPSYIARCGRGGTPRPAIGNEAVSCSVIDSAQGVSEQVVGRVRDRAFVIQIRTSGNAQRSKGSSSTAPNPWPLRALQVAEQVAGSLF